MADIIKFPGVLELDPNGQQWADEIRSWCNGQQYVVDVTAVQIEPGVFDVWHFNVVSKPDAKKTDQADTTNQRVRYDPFGRGTLDLDIADSRWGKKIRYWDDGEVYRMRLTIVQHAPGVYEVVALSDPASSETAKPAETKESLRDMTPEMLATMGSQRDRKP